MTSGFWISIFVPSFLIIFVIWEFVQLYRRRKGNRSARTMSQYIIHKANEGSKFWRWFAILFPPFLFIVAIWLWFHWLSPCYSFGLFCDVDI